MAPVKTTTGRFLTPPAIADMLGVNARKIYAAIDAGELRAVDLSVVKGKGRPRWRVAPADLDRFLAGRSNTTSTPAPAPTRSTRRRAGRRYL